MGRLFWKFFFSILLAQVVAAAGIGGAMWLRIRDATQQHQTAIDTGPRAEDAITSAAATLQFGGVAALKQLLEGMERQRVHAVNGQGQELLGRTVRPAAVQEARKLLAQNPGQRVVRELKAADGQRYLLYLPARMGPDGMGFGGPPDLLKGAQIAAMDAASATLRDSRGSNPGGDFRGRDGSPPGQRGEGFGGPGPGGFASPRPGGPPPMDGFDSRAGARFSGGEGGAPQPGFTSGGPGFPGAQGNFGPGGGRMMGPRVQPLTPAVLIGVSVFASLLFAVLLAWYFSRPIRDLRLAFEAASLGDLAPRFSHRGAKRGDELSDLGRDFDRMTARLRSLMDGQTRLMHDVSHELRSPLARLQAAIGLAHQSPEKMQASMERIERESVRMDKLVGELLTLSRLEAGALDAARDEINMADLMDEIVADAAFEGATQGRAIELQGDGDVMLLGQADLLARAIENIVRNAIKHSPDGGTVQVEMDAARDQGQFRIRVLDRGPGVAAADLQSIFQPFFRSSATVKDVEGHGLGLAIALQVVQAHGGSLQARNRDGGGLCVEIVLPFAR